MDHPTDGIFALFPSGDLALKVCRTPNRRKVTWVVSWRFKVKVPFKDLLNSPEKENFEAKI